MRRLEALHEAAHGVVVFGFGGHAVSAGDLANFHSSLAVAVVGDEFVQNLLQLLANTAVADAEEFFFVGFGWFRGGLFDRGQAVQVNLFGFLFGGGSRVYVGQNFFGKESGELGRG